jgi:alanine racemase
MAIATLPVGYADGYSRLLSNKADVLVRGRRCRVVGRVTMDMMMVDVTRVPNASIGDEVVLVGAQGKERIRIEDLAADIGAISYEVACSISHRVPRIET